MFSSTRILSCAVALSALCLAACDEEYDLSKDINTDIQIGNRFKVPVGRTDTVYLSRIIEESETLTENSGIYEVTSEGNTSTVIDPFDDVEIHNFTPEIEDLIISIPQGASAGVEADAGSAKSSGSYSIDEELPREVQEIYCADFKGDVISTYLKLSLGSLPEGAEAVTLTNLNMIFPDFVHLTNGSNQFHIDRVTLNAAQPTASYTIDIDWLEIGHDEQSHYIANGANGRKHFIVTESIDITTNASITIGESIPTQNIQVVFEYYMDDETAALEKIAGKFNTTANISSNIAINDIPDFLRSENTQLSPQEIYVYLDLDNPVNVTGNFSLDMTSTNKTQSSNASASIKVLPAAMNNILICNYQASVPGYTRAVVPFKFNNLNIEYTDTIDNLLSDLEDVADKTDRLIVRGVGVTNIPTDLVASVELYDIYGNILNGIDVDLSKFRFDAAPDGVEATNNLELALTEREGSDDLERLEMIVFIINAASTENITLRPKQYLLIKDIFVEIPDGINMTL